MFTVPIPIFTQAIGLSDGQRDLPREQGRWYCLEEDDKQSYYYQESGKSGLCGLNFVLIWLGGIM